MLTDYEQLKKTNNPRVKEYSYYGSTGVLARDGHSHGVCFGWKIQEISAIQNKTPNVKLSTEFVIIPVMSRENSQKWLDLLAKEIKFEYEWLENFTEKTNNYRPLVSLSRRENVPAVCVQFPHPMDYGHCVIFGNLFKGLSEFAWLSEKHLQDTTPKLKFFDKNFNALQAMKKHFSGTTSGLQITGHLWWNLFDTQKENTNHFTTRSLKEYFERYDTLKPAYGQYYNTCLGRTL